MNIGIDMMGGDFAPFEVVKGLQNYLSVSDSPANLYCFGNEAELKISFVNGQLTLPSIHLVHCPYIIGMKELPAKAFRDKPNSSIAAGFQFLTQGTIDAFISAGNTGAMLVGAHYTIKTIPGILRPAIASIIPKVSGGSGILIDVGLNSDCKPEHLNQFSILGSLYARYVLNIQNPKIALLNVGEEDSKGNLLAQSSYPLLKDNPEINFVGNIEGRDLLMDTADVVVCDGFTGNIILKLIESLHEVNRVRNLNDSFLQRFHYENYGGTPVLGIGKPVIIGHGISSANAFCNMVLLAEKMVATDICGKIQQSFNS